MRAAPHATLLEVVRTRFEQQARDYRGSSPLYAQICAAVAADDFTLELMLEAPAHQRRPTLLQAAIHDLLLAGTEHPLAAHVPTVAAPAAHLPTVLAPVAHLPTVPAPAAHLPTVAASRAATAAPGPLALDFCRAHRDALAQILATRTTQTNEVNRAAALLPALAHATPPGRPLRLVELGASAGLNLLADRFTYRYDDGPPIAGGAGTAGSRVVCTCNVEGELPPLAAPPVIGERIGVDLEPIDLEDAVERRWLMACVWPDDSGRVARLRAAIELARRYPPTVLRGDALALLAELVTGGGSGVHPVIWHSWVLAYWTVSAQRDLGTAIDALGAERDLTWIYLEQPSETPALPTPTLAGFHHDPSQAALVAVSYRDGVRTAQRLADAHGHLHYMRWLAG